jgi:GcrA cell cycle regulator
MRAPNWPAERDERLRVLWAEGLPASAIGRDLGVSKDGVVGRVHRLHLAPRPSAIKPFVPGVSYRPKPKPPALSLLSPPAAPIAAVPATRIPPSPPRPDPPDPLPAWSVPAPAPPPPPPSQCCWPIGDPGTRGFRFCPLAAVPARPYCPKHVAVAYVPIRPADLRRLEA